MEHREENFGLRIADLKARSQPFDRLRASSQNPGDKRSSKLKAQGEIVKIVEAVEIVEVVIR